MNWRRGLFRLWLALSALWLSVIAVLFYPQVVSPYIEPQAYILRDDSDSGFLQLDNVSDSNDQDFKAAYQIEIEFPNKVTLFAKDDTPMSRSLLNIAKRSLLRFMLSCVGLASKHAAGGVSGLARFQGGT